MKTRIKRISFVMACLLLLIQVSAVAQDVSNAPAAEENAGYQPGDGNGDGLVTMADALLALQAATQKIVITDSEKQALDMDGNGIVQTQDALAVFQIATKKLTMPAFVSSFDPLLIAGTDFGLDLLRQTALEQDNAVVSPLSLQSALAMAANGAKGNTLAQMEQALADGYGITALNDYLANIQLQTEERNNEDAALNLANAIWLQEGFAANEEFLQTIEEYYEAEVHTAPFDEQTVQDINDWIAAQTDNMIPQLLDSLSPESRFELINAVLFEAKWAEGYESYQVREETFTTADGQEQTAQMMHSTEYTYLQDDNAVGFIKNYENGYGFVALLPEEDLSVNDYLATLTGERFQQILQNREHIQVNAAMPKFQAKCRLDNDPAKVILQNMGMTDMFNGLLADFSGIGEDLYIDHVITECVINVDEKGTKAAAASIVSGAESTSPEPQPTRTVILDRPFVYAIVDTATGQPLFMGQVTSIDA